MTILEYLTERAPVYINIYKKESRYMAGLLMVLRYA